MYEKLIYKKTTYLPTYSTTYKNNEFVYKPTYKCYATQ